MKKSSRKRLDKCTSLAIRQIRINVMNNCKVTALKNLVFFPFCAGDTHAGSKGRSQNQRGLFNSFLASRVTDSGPVVPW